MSEWWTYRLYDFLLFTPRTYYRLFELYNAAIWPGQIVAVVAGLWLAWLCATGRLRPAMWILAAAWLWTGVAFLAMRYAKINFAAKYGAWGFGVEAALLGWTAIRGSLEGAGRFSRAGVAIVVFAVLLEPLSAPLLGRPLSQLEPFGVAPDPTVVATLGALVALRPRRRWLLMIVPVLWCALTGLTLLAMGAQDWWIAPAVGVVAIMLATTKRRRKAFMTSR